jgi:hypothetical protein
MDSKIIPIELQTRSGMLGEDLKAIVLRNAEHVQQRLINDLANLCAIFLRLAFEKIDSDERHNFSLHGVPCCVSLWMRAPLDRVLLASAPNRCVTLYDSQTSSR